MTSVLALQNIMNSLFIKLQKIKQKKKNFFACFNFCMNFFSSIFSSIYLKSCFGSFEELSIECFIRNPAHRRESVQNQGQLYEELKTSFLISKTTKKNNRFSSSPYSLFCKNTRIQKKKTIFETYF